MNKDYSEMIAAFEMDSDVQHLRDLYFQKTIPEIFGVCRSELAHSSFLAWLFNPTVNEFGQEPLRLLLQLCAEKNSSCDLFTLVDIESVKVETEKYVKSEKSKGRVDVFLECDAVCQGKKEHLMLIIENKVYSCEHSSQTETYRDYFDKFDCKKIYIFLTPPYHKQGAECEKYIHLTYQDLLDNILEPLLNKSVLSSRTHLILEEYIKSLTIPMNQLVDCDGIKTLETTILAISMKEKNLLRSFWDKYKGLIFAAINTLADDDAEVKEVKNTLSTRDYSKYSVNGVGSYGKGRMVEAVVNLYISNHPQVAVTELKSVFPDSLNSQGMIKSFEEGVKDEKRWYIANGKKCYISNDWGISNIPNFIDYVHNNIKGIEITKVE